MVSVHKANSLNDMFGVKGKVGFITGAGSGLGAEISVALAIGGADVVVTDFILEGAQKTADTLRAMGRKALALYMDVTDEDSIKAAVDQAMVEYGRIDILFNNAGITDPVPALLHEYDSDHWRKVLAVNLDGIFYTAKVVLGIMVMQGNGKIINMASIWGLAGSSSVCPLPAYSATKGAVVNLTRELGLQYATKNIQINALCPGFYHTNIGNNSFDTKDFFDAVTAWTPMGRVADASEIRGPALFLASSASDFMTGQTLVVDGGCLAK